MTTSQNQDQYEYGLSAKNYKKLSHELQQYHDFMIQPKIGSQEQPITKATADVYLRHAKLFLGWYVAHEYRNDEHNNNNNSSSSDKNATDIEDDNLSIYTIIPNKNRESSTIILNFILWLRTTRSISPSYEANILRGITKLLKYRFHAESRVDPSYGDTKSYQDIPIIEEMRKMHMEASKKSKKNERSSDEGVKWLDWIDYLKVVQSLKEDVFDLIKRYGETRWDSSADYDKEQQNNKSSSSSKAAVRRKIAIAYQRYLLLAFFSYIPDRQRTFRELDLTTNFFKDSTQNCYYIKHGPNDYKTGKTYGERPPLILSQILTHEIDEFIRKYRPYLLNPSIPYNNKLFVQQRTGKPHTTNSIYYLVSLSCFQKSGKRTNPHLLRDMIVTHVRGGNGDKDAAAAAASEKELEALALYMGHSLAMQRNSYDRRTMTQKVAPAVELLQNVNSQKKEGK